MRNWVIAIEIHEASHENMTRVGIETIIGRVLENNLPPCLSYQIKEIANTTYGAGPENVMLLEGNRRGKPFRIYPGVKR